MVERLFAINLDVNLLKSVMNSIHVIVNPFRSSVKHTAEIWQSSRQRMSNFGSKAT